MHGLGEKSGDVIVEREGSSHRHIMMSVGATVKMPRDDTCSVVLADSDVVVTVF